MGGKINEPVFSLRIETFCERVRFARRGSSGKLARNRERELPFFRSIRKYQRGGRSTVKAIGEGRDKRRINLERGSVKGRTETSLLRVIRSINYLSLSLSLVDESLLFRKNNRVEEKMGGNGLICPFDPSLGTDELLNPLD